MQAELKIRTEKLDMKGKDFWMPIAHQWFHYMGPTIEKGRRYIVTEQKYNKSYWSMDLFYQCETRMVRLADALLFE